MLVGRLGLSKADALCLTRLELEAIIKHGLEREKEDYKRFRWLASVLVNISGKSVKKEVKPVDLFRFDDERTDNGFKKFWQAATS